MKKICTLVLTVAMLLSTGMTGESENAGLPVNDTEELTAVQIPWEDALSYLENIQDDGMSIAEVKDFYTCGMDSHYGYDDLAKRSNGAERQRCYNNLLEQCRRIAADYSDIKPVDHPVSDGSYITTYDLPADKDTEHIYHMDPEAGGLEAVEVYYIFRNDHPEYYWLSSGVLYGINSIGETILIPGVYSEYADGETRMAMDEAIEDSFEEYISAADALEKKDNYTVAKLMHDMIAAAVEYGYDENGVALDTSYAHSIVGVLDGDPDTDVVCEGYSKTYQLLLNRLGINNIYVVGEAAGGGHAWNFVEMDNGKYYGVDITWDDNGDNAVTEYFAKGAGKFNKDHTAYLPDNTGEYFLYELPELPKGDYTVSEQPPTEAPTEQPSEQPTEAPTELPTEQPPSEKPTNPPVYEKAVIRCNENAVDNNGDKCMRVDIDKVIKNSSFIFTVYDDNGLIKSIGMLSMNNAYVFENGGTAFYLYPEADDRNIKLFLWNDGNAAPLADVCEIYRAAE